DFLHPIVGIAVDELEERREQLALVFRVRRADLDGNALTVRSLEVDRPLVRLVLPTGVIARLAADPHVGAAAFLADRLFLGDEDSIKPRTLARHDLDDLHDSPLRARIMSIGTCSGLPEHIIGLRDGFLLSWPPNRESRRTHHVGHADRQPARHRPRAVAYRPARERAVAGKGMAGVRGHR